MAVGGLVLLLAACGSVGAYRYYQDRIPNGDHVPHPCKSNYIWWGVGHHSPMGGGVRNAFGKDFENHGRQWTTELCRLDSDKDGRTNGEELGDPNCVWTNGTVPAKTKDITHPGVCTPWGSSRCEAANAGISCDTGEFVCPDLNSPDVFNVTLRFPPTNVPAELTSYMCFTFELDFLDPNTDYHLIGTQPFTDNRDVMHHSVLSSCDLTGARLDKPTECNMVSEGCSASLSIWTLGMVGECVYKDAGFKLNTNTVSRLSIQHHWTNPELRTDYIDSSGLILYLTKKLRRYNAGYFNTGDLHLDIPGGQSRWVESSYCSPHCTHEYMKGNVYFMSGWNHMHYLGYQQNVEHFRDDVKLRDLTPDDIYSYDNPLVHTYNPLVEVRPGDGLKTTCVYRSTSRSRTTTFGRGTYDEMCLGIFTYFPVENITETVGCFTYDDIEYCRANATDFMGCDYAMLWNDTSPERQEMFSKIKDNCYTYGRCREECRLALAEVRQHACFRGKLFKMTMDLITGDTATKDMMQFSLRVMTCANEDEEEEELVTYPYPSSSTPITRPDGMALLSVFPLLLSISLL